jgi:hypothetical protein
MKVDTTLDYRLSLRVPNTSGGIDNLKSKVKQNFVFWVLSRNVFHFTWLTTDNLSHGLCSIRFIADASETYTICEDEFKLSDIHRYRKIKPLEGKSTVSINENERR